MCVVVQRKHFVHILSFNLCSLMMIVFSESLKVHSKQIILIKFDKFSNSKKMLLLNVRFFC